jgi:hypothetical protein
MSVDCLCEGLMLDDVVRRCRRLRSIWSQYTDYRGAFGTRTLVLFERLFVRLGIAFCFD